MTADLFTDLPRNRTRLDAWKERNGIVTGETATGWLAIARKDFCETHQYYPDLTFAELTDMFQCFTEDYRETGENEEAACYALAVKLSLPFLESITQADLVIESNELRQS